MRRFLAALLLSSAATAALAGDPREPDWAQWRGPNRDGLSPDTGLLKQWPSEGPPVAWKATGIGNGFSSVSLSGTRVLTLGDTADSCMLFALNLADGKELWSAKIGATGGKRNPGPRSTPAADGKLVFALGQHGDLVCVDEETGKEKWRKSLRGDFGGRSPNWDYSESPLLDGDHVLCTPGGSRGAVVALKKATGETVWQSSEFKDAAHYASLVPIEIGGVRQYLVLTQKSVAGIAAKDGKLLWRGDFPGTTAVVATPIYKDGIVFATSGYRVGSKGYKVAAEGGGFKCQEIYEAKEMQNHHGGVILVGDHLYGLSDSGGLKCLELKTGKEVWSNRSVGKGSIAYADGHLVVRSENAKGGEMALVEASSSGYKEKGRFSLPDPAGQPTWAHPVVFGGKMYVRNQSLLVSYAVKAK